LDLNNVYYEKIELSKEEEKYCYLRLFYHLDYKYNKY